MNKEPISEEELEYLEIEKQLLNETAQKSHIVPANDFILQLDIDSEEGYQQYKKGMEMVQNNIPLLHIVETMSKSGGKHITIYLAEAMDVWKRLALQAILGSDFKREALNFNRIIHNDPFPILFYEERK